MKKVSEVKKEIERVSCDITQRDRITDLLVACGVLEQDKEAKFKVGDVWKYFYTTAHGSGSGKIKIKEIKGSTVMGNKVWDDGVHEDDGIVSAPETNLTELLWRDP